MDRYRNLFKQNTLTSARSKKNKVQDFLRGRRNRRSEVMDIQRGIEAEDVRDFDMEEKLPTSASKKQLRPEVRPFVVGKVRHKIHSPPFLHQSVSSEDKRKITPLKSFAPINYQFRKRFLIASPSPTKYGNYRLSPFSKKSSNSKKTNLKLVKQDSDHVTVRSYKKTTPADPHSKDSLNTPVFGRENCEDKPGNARKQLWPDPSEEVIFGRSNVARALKLKDSTPKSPQGLFVERDSCLVNSPPEKENIISSSLMFHKNLEKIVQNMDSDYSEDFDSSEPGENQNSLPLATDEDVMNSGQDTSSENQACKIDDQEMSNRGTETACRRSQRLSRNRSKYEWENSKSSKLGRDYAPSVKSLQNSMHSIADDSHNSIAQSLGDNENTRSTSLNSIEADVLNKALTDSLESSVCDDEKREDTIDHTSPEKCNNPLNLGQNSSSNLSSPISLECREEMADSSSPTDHSHQSLNSKSSNKEDENSSAERTDLLFLRTTTSLDCTEKPTEDAFEKYERAPNNAFEALSDISSPTLLLRNLADLDESITMQIFPQMKMKRQSSIESCPPGGVDHNAIGAGKAIQTMACNTHPEGLSNSQHENNSFGPSENHAADDELDAQDISQKSNRNDSSALPIFVPSDINSPFSSSSLVSTDFKRVSRSSSSEEYVSSEKVEEETDAQLSESMSNISSRSSKETSQTRERVSQNYYGVSRIDLYIDSPPNGKRCSNVTEKKPESCHQLTQDYDISIPSHLFSKTDENINDSIQRKSLTVSKEKDLSRESTGGSSFTRLFMSPSSDAQAQTSMKSDELNVTKNIEIEPNEKYDELPTEAPANLRKHPERNTFSCKEATLEKMNRECYSDAFQYSSAASIRDLQSKNESLNLRKSLRLSQANSEMSEDVSLRESFFQSPRLARESQEIDEDELRPQNIFTSPKSSSQRNEEVLSVDSPTPNNIETAEKDYEASSEDEVIENSVSSVNTSTSDQENDAEVFETHADSHSYPPNAEFNKLLSSRSEDGEQIPKLSNLAKAALKKDLEVKTGLVRTLSSSLQSKSPRLSRNEMRLSEGNYFNESRNASRAESSYHLLELMTAQPERGGEEKSLKNTSKLQGEDEDTSYTARKSLPVAEESFEVNIGEELQENEFPRDLSRNSILLLKSKNSEMEESSSNMDFSKELHNEPRKSSKMEVSGLISMGAHKKSELPNSEAAEVVENVIEKRVQSITEVLNDSADTTGARSHVDQEDAVIPENLITHKYREDSEEKSFIEEEKAGDVPKTPKDFGKKNQRIGNLSHVEMNKENLGPNHISFQDSPYKLRTRTPKNQMSPAVTPGVSTPLMSQDKSTGDTNTTEMSEKVSNALPTVSQKKERHLDVVKQVNSNVLQDEVNIQTSPYSLRVRTPRSQKNDSSSKIRTPLRSRENLRMSPDTKEVEVELDGMSEKVISANAGRNGRRKGRLCKNVAENELNVENLPNKLRTRTPQNQKTTDLSEPSIPLQPRDQSNSNSETKDSEIEPVLESQTTRRRRAAKASSKNVVQEQIGTETSSYKLRARTPQNNKDANLESNPTPLESQSQPEQCAELEARDEKVPKVPSEPTSESQRGKRRRKVVTPLKQQKEAVQDIELEVNQEKEVSKTQDELDENHIGKKRGQKAAKNSSKKLATDQAVIQDSPYKLRNRTPRTKNNADTLQNSTPLKSQGKVDCRPEVEVETTNEIFQTPNEPEMRNCEKKKSRKAVKNISEVLVVNDASDEGSRYKLRSRTPKSQTNDMPVEQIELSAKKTPRRKKTPAAVARALPMDLPGVVIDFENSVSVGGTNDNPAPSTPKSPIVVPFRKENPQISDKSQELGSPDSDDEELDYRVFLSRVIAKRALDVALSPITPVSNARQAKTPAKIPGLIITSETPKTPITVVPLSIEESPIASMASPMRLLSLRNRAISVTPSPKKKTPRKQI